ncbi:MAG TPA: methionine--tRNA ligase [Planctomycetaceae bacterium]|nr:methionine--tRNA ligase [Planctomycetaceae bacterium]
MNQRRILVTSALPYANGHIHIGHLVEYLQTDMWVRFQKLRGRRCIYICADDTHGTAIMMSAQKQGISEEELIGRMQKAHVEDFTGFQIEFDNYGSTNSPESREYCEEIWAAVRKAGLVVEKEVTQLFDAVAGTFLADRQVKGTCPKCGAKDQYGDNCDKCGATYGPSDLIDPVSAFTGATPEVRSATHLFIEIERLHQFLAEWTRSDEHLQPEVANYLAGHFLHEPLRDWDVSRPSPYFGFEIPDSPGNYWYVWFDAPIGYIGSTRQWCDRQGEKFDDWWRSDETEIHHFIGKDITYFHTLFWPAMLKTAEFSLPTKVHIHGFLTVGGEKMSKSKGTFIRARTYLDYLDPSYLRYYYASKLSPRVDDLDLNLDEFITKINSDLVGKVVNLASRTAKFVEKTGLSTAYPDDGGLFRQAADEGEEIAEAYQQCDYNRAMRRIMAIADRANQFVEHAQPWVLNKSPEKARELQDVCTVGLNLFRQIAVYLAPVLPRLAEQTAELLGKPIESWAESQVPLVATTVGKFKHMMTRVEKKQVDAMIDASAEPEAEGTDASSDRSSDSGQWLADEPLVETCSFEDFLKVDLRIARIVEAAEVPKADKLLQLTLSLGGETRLNVFAGIKVAYKPEDLVGRLVLCVANLAPRKMKFGTSEGMIVASGPGGKDVFLLVPDEGAQPGQRAH